MTSDVSRLVSERMAHWHAQGVHGAAIYEALATDPDLPIHFEQKEVTEISGDTRVGLKARRARGMPPAYVRVSRQRVVYPRADLFRWLRERYVGERYQAAE